MIINLPLSDDLGKWAKAQVGEKAMNPHDIALVLLIAEQTDTEPDFVIQRLFHLRTAVRDAIYGTVNPSGR